MGNPKQKWTAEEEDALRAGVAKHGTGKWKNIQKDPEFNPHLYSRSNIDLKDKWRNMSVSINGQGPREKARTPKPKASGIYVGIKRKPGAAANDKAYPQANVVRVTRSAAKHKASTQERKLDLKKDVSINRKPGATANNKASSQAKMFTLPSISDSIKVQDINGDSYGTMKRNHGVPSDANLYVEEPLSVSSRKRIRQMDSDVKRSAAAKHKASTQERKLDIINRKRGAAANDKASPQANVVRVTRSAAAKHKASTQVSKLDIKKHVIKRKRGAAANDKSSPQAKMFLGILPLISNSIKKVQEDSDGMKGPNHDTPSNTNVQVEEPSNSSIRSSKRIRQMDSLIEVMTTKMSQEAAIKRKLRW